MTEYCFGNVRFVLAVGIVGNQIVLIGLKRTFTSNQTGLTTSENLCRLYLVKPFSPAREMVQMSDYMTKVTFEIAGHGAYTSDLDLYNEAFNLRTREDLYAEVRETAGSFGIKGLYKLQKFELAAMVADWATAVRTERRNRSN